MLLRLSISRPSVPSTRLTIGRFEGNLATIGAGSVIPSRRSEQGKPLSGATTLEVRLEFGAVCGGFRLTFGRPAPGESRVVEIGDGSMEMDVLPGLVPRLRCLRSARDRGGLPLRILFRQASVAQSVCGTHLVQPPIFAIGPVQLWQAHDHVALWLGHGRDLPRPHWPRVVGIEVGLSIWLSSQRVRIGSLPPGAIVGAELPLVAGLAIPTANLPEASPVEILAVAATDLG